MECDRFIHEKVGETDSPEFRAHRAECAACARDLEELQEVRTLYRQASVERYPGRVPRVGRLRGAWMPVAAAAVAMIAVLVILLGGLTKPVDPAAHSEPPMFYRAYLEPWASDTRLSKAFDDTWDRLEKLERNAQ